MSKKKKLYDVCINIVASGIMTCGLQLVVYPILAGKYDSSDYGIILTIMGICNTISATFGNALNNVRLIRNNDYEEKNIKGDFNNLVLVGSCFSFLFGCFITFLLSHDLVVSLGIGFTSLFSVLRLYYCVKFRIDLEFGKILCANFITALGYIAGTLVAIILGFWPMAFITGEFLGAIYVFVKSGYIKESFLLTREFKFTLKSYLVLLFSTLIINVGVYLDRFFLHPILGDEAVTIYTVASIMGKCIGIIMLPISGVLLSYFSQKDYVMTYRIYIKQCIMLISVTIIFIVLITPISPILTKLLYPSVYESSAEFIFLANLVAIVAVLGNMLTPAILKFVETYWQVVIAIAYILVYIVVGMWFSAQWGLRGFCYAALCANVLKCIILIILGKRIDRGK